MIQFSCYLTLLIESIVSFIYMEITNHSLNQEILISMQITFSFIYCALHFKNYGNIKAVMDVVTTFILAVVFEIHFQNRTSLSLLRLMLTLQCSITKLSQTNNNKQLAMLYCLFITYATARLLIADIEFVYLSIIITFEIFFFTYRSIKQKDLYQIVEQVTRKDDDEHFYEPLLQNIKIGVCVLNSNVQLKYANSRALKILNAEDLNSACTQLHQFLQLGLQQNDKFDQEQLLVRRRTQRGQSQKTDPSLINRMIDHVNKRLDTKSEKLQDLSVRFRKVTNIKDFKSLFLSFYENQTRKYKRQYARNNGLKINITQQNRKQKTYLFQFYQAHDNKLQPQYIIQIIDNTEKEQLQNFIQQYQFKTFHFNSFSHELRTPLNCSLQMLQALGEVVDCQINKQYLKPAIISNKLLMHQINDLLDYGSFCLNDFKIFTSKFYITEIFNILREYYEDACEMKKLKLTFEIDHNLDHSQIESDFERILQLLVNLINNSLKFTRQNDCIIVKASEQQNQMSSFIKFTVYDTGIGISKQGLMSIKNALITDNQDVFTQINNIATKYVGLGLIIGSMVAKELSFNETPLLKIKSKENLFFQVSFKVKNQIVRLVRDDCPLPLERQLSDSIYPLTISVTSKSICQQMPNSQQTFLAMRHYNLAQILICDDVSFNLMSLQMLIQNLGHKCDLAYDGREAIQLCEYRNQENLPQYKLILMDIEMPVINGYDTAKSILDSCGETNIVMCSAYDSSSNIEQSKEAGMRDFITKPVRLDHLKRILNTYL